MSESILEVTGVAAGYGDIRAIWDVSLAASSGEVTVVLGHNGAGKTTLLSAISGLLPVQAGTVRFDGQQVDQLPADTRSHRGIALVQEGKRIFRRRTVEQNLTLGGTRLKRSQLSEAIDRAYTQFPMLADRRRQTAGALSGGQQQMLAIAQALVPGPRVLMLDEPSAGLAPAIFDDVLRIVTELRDAGLAVLLVEQLVDQAMSVADSVIHLENGRMVNDTRVR